MGLITERRWAESAERVFTDPGTWFAIAAILVPLAALVVYGYLRPLTDRDREIQRCRKLTGHRTNRKPVRPFYRGLIFERLPGLYAQQECACRYKRRTIWLSGPNSTKARAMTARGEL